MGKPKASTKQRPATTVQENDSHSMLDENQSDKGLDSTAFAPPLPVESPPKIPNPPTAPRPKPRPRSPGIAPSSPGPRRRGDFFQSDSSPRKDRSRSRSRSRSRMRAKRRYYRRSSSSSSPDSRNSLRNSRRHSSHSQNPDITEMFSSFMAMMGPMMARLSKDPSGMPLDIKKIPEAALGRPDSVAPLPVVLQDDDARSVLSNQSMVQEKSIASEGVTLHAPSHTGFSLAGEGIDLDDISIQHSQLNEEINPRHESEFLSVIENLHTVLGDDLPRRTFKKSNVKALSQFDTEDTTARKCSVAFPHSGLMTSTFDCIQEQMWGDKSIKLDDPSTLPSSLQGAKKVGKRKIPHYREKFYSVPTDAVQPKPPEAGESLETYVGIKESTCMVRNNEVRDIERQSRKALLALNAVDVLVAGIRRIDAAGDPSAADLQAKNSMFSSLVWAVKHATEFAATSVSLSMLARRRSFLDLAPSSLVPQAAKKWMLNQKIVQEEGVPPSLFGEVVPKLQKYTAQHNKLHAVASASRPKPKAFVTQTGNSSNYHSGRNKSSQVGNQTNPNWSNARGRGRGFLKTNSRGGLSMKPRGGRTSSLPPPKQTP